ncbi:MAG: hypothetical protein KBI35_05845 [Ruminococcus sp.]|nr:hypothetical protein [Ruminococcus sp.]
MPPFETAFCLYSYYFKATPHKARLTAWQRIYLHNFRHLARKLLAGRQPSGKFETNALILKLTMIAYNILRIIGTAAMKGNDLPVRHSTIKRRRIRTVIDDLIPIAGHLTDHARKLRLSLGHCNGWICTFLRVGNSL